MPNSKVFVTRAIPADGLALLNGQSEVEVDVWPDMLPPTYEELTQRVRDCAGLISLVTDRVDAPLLAAAPNLRVVSQMAVGFDNIDLAAATARRLPVGNTPGVLTDATADFAWALLMAAARRVVEGDRFVRAGHWKAWHPTLLVGLEVHGASLGLIGFGRIGQAVARRARGFDMRVRYYNGSGPVPEAEAASGATYAPLDTLLAESDFLSLHVPLTLATRHLINATALAKVKRGAILVNTARGGVVDQAALHAALTSGRLAAAGLDVTDPEPLPMNSPLLQLENVVIAPHIASGSLQARTRMATMAAENMLAGLRGDRLPYCVNPEVYG
ncbi:MAG: D-glycerate dehydrogenase [Anaerolineales bacterium]|nr:D-glycerate dehydrogenase [Anaerolineales bacterium]